jgi:23S rRNA pseudouridine2605 synthase
MIRINRYVSTTTGCSRRQADDLIAEGHVGVDGQQASLGMMINDTQTVTIDGKVLSLPTSFTTIMLNKPVGYVVSREGQGSKTVYDLLPDKYHQLKPIGRLDKDSSGLLLLTNDGQLAQDLSHPSSHKQKIYIVKLNKPLHDKDLTHISTTGVKLSDGVSKFEVQAMSGSTYKIIMHEGRNRQIRRTFEALGYRVVDLHRTAFGDHQLGDLKLASYIRF